MRRRSGSWFTIVATDLFCGAFAAIVMIDSVTPKHIGGASEDQLVEISFNHPGSCPADGDAIVLQLDDAGERISTMDRGLAVKSNGDTCVLSGILPLETAADLTGACIFVAELPKPEPNDFHVTVSNVGSATVAPCR